MRLDAVIDKNLFIAEPRTPTIQILEPTDQAVPATPGPTPVSQKETDSLIASPFVVRPYPPRTQSPILESPNTQRRTEGVYDRFLMATSGVKRVGRGYQSENVGPTANNPRGLSHSVGPALPGHKSAPKLFLSARRSAMPPPVSSEDFIERRAVSIDELGVMQTYNGVSSTTISKDPRTNTVKNVRKAIKAIVTGKSGPVKSPAARSFRV